MCQLTAYQKSELRKKYEHLDAAHQGGMPAWDKSMQQLSTREITAIFSENEMNPQRWPSFTDLEDHLRNCATLRHYNAPVRVV